jgi:colicin import membrane protein
MAETTTTTAAETTATSTTETDVQKNETAQQQTNTTQTNEEFERRVQSEADKRSAEQGKRIAELIKELETMKKEKMTADEVKEYEDTQRAKEMEAKEKELTDRENRLTAITELTKVDLYDGSEATNAFLDLVVRGSDAKQIAANVKAVKTYIDKQVADGVDKTFKANGRDPKTGGNSSTDTDTKKNSVAATIGKKAAETAKKSNEIIDYYVGGKK